MVLLVRIFRTEIFCFENLGFVLLLGLMLFRYTKIISAVSRRDFPPMTLVDVTGGFADLMLVEKTTPCFFTLWKDSKHFKMQFSWL